MATHSENWMNLNSFIFLKFRACVIFMWVAYMDGRCAAKFHLAQLVKPSTSIQKVPGSSPGGGICFSDPFFFWRGGGTLLHFGGSRPLFAALSGRLSHFGWRCPGHSAFRVQIPDYHQFCSVEPVWGMKETSGFFFQPIGPLSVASRVRTRPPGLATGYLLKAGLGTGFRVYQVHFCRRLEGCFVVFVKISRGVREVCRILEIFDAFLNGFLRYLQVFRVFSKAFGELLRFLTLLVAQKELWVSLENKHFRSNSDGKTFIFSFVSDHTPLNFFLQRSFTHHLIFHLKREHTKIIPIPDFFFKLHWAVPVSPPNIASRVRTRPPGLATGYLLKASLSAWKGKESIWLTSADVRRRCFVVFVKISRGFREVWKFSTPF